MKVLVMDGGSYYWPHDEFGAPTENINVLSNTPEEVSLVVFTGGADINPSLYSHQKNPKSWCSDYRDTRDMAAYHLAQKHGIPCTGICRGGQFLTAMAGGFLFQHVTRHGRGTHWIESTTVDPKTNSAKFVASGDHHQMFGVPLATGAELLAWTSPDNISTVYEFGDGTSQLAIDVEPEAVFYPSINSLAVQYHPEWMDKDSQGVRYYRELLRKYFK